ncbi:MAG: LPS-assembly protein LptD, partial [Chitinophagaceae bacterium]|nr:LPS-assembly protein LptD [Chitinophagaceae bacterium]
MVTAQIRVNYPSPDAFHTFLTSYTDTLKPLKLLPLNNDTVPPKKNDASVKNIVANKIIDTAAPFVTTDTFNLKFSKDSLEGPITYTAEDSMVLKVPAKRIILYGKKATVHYKENDLTAPIIELDQQTGNITASIKRDSSGKVISLPNFKQADFTSQSDSIRFNLKTGKGITKSTYTQQGEMYVYGEVIKKVSPEVFYAQRARFTTCNLDTPHFAFVSNRIKFINNKVAISGPVHPEFEGVPIPIYLPFGIYPLNQARHSGFLAPSFATNEQLGLGLEGFGYYKILSPNWDVITKANLYSYGGWNLSINPRYIKKYHYSGSMSFNVQHYNFNFIGDPDYQKNRSYQLTWYHAADIKSRPGVTFQANVNAGSSSYNNFRPDNPVLNFQNNLTSSISYSKTWKDKPYNLTVTANHNQNSLTKLFIVSLPDVGFNVSTVYPFRKKDFAGTPKWYQNLGIAYNGEARNQFSFYDTVPHLFRHILDTLQWGAHHSVPITLSLPPLGVFQIGPTISYEETWFQSKFFRSYDTSSKQLSTLVTKGFFTARHVSFGLAASTRIFGMFVSKKKDAKIIAIRHEMRPTLSMNYTPDLNKQNYYYARIDSAGDRQLYSYFDGNLNSGYAPGRFGGLAFNLDNNFQMKVRNKKDTGDNAVKKITLIDNLGFNASYNFFDTSFYKLSTFNVNLSSNLFQKFNISASTTLDPYDANKYGTRIKRLLWQRKPFSFGRLLFGQFSLSSQFQGGSKNKLTAGRAPVVLPNQNFEPGYSNNEYNNELAYIRNNPGEFTDFNIPWSFNFSYSLSFARNFKDSLVGLKTDYNQNITLSGSLGLSPKWQISLSSSYNITLKQLGLFTMALSREMHCWQMSINLTPVG